MIECLLLIRYGTLSVTHMEIFKTQGSGPEEIINKTNRKKWRLNFPIVQAGNSRELAKQDAFFCQLSQDHPLSCEVVFGFMQFKKPSNMGYLKLSLTSHVTTLHKGWSNLPLVTSSKDCARYLIFLDRQHNNYSFEVLGHSDVFQVDIFNIWDQSKYYSFFPQLVVYFNWVTFSWKTEHKVFKWKEKWYCFII